MTKVKTREVIAIGKPNRPVVVLLDFINEENQLRNDLFDGYAKFPDDISKNVNMANLTAQQLCLLTEQTIDSITNKVQKIGFLKAIIDRISSVVAHLLVIQLVDDNARDNVEILNMVTTAAKKYVGDIVKKLAGELIISYQAGPYINVPVATSDDNKFKVYQQKKASANLSIRVNIHYELMKLPYDTIYGWLRNDVVTKSLARKPHGPTTTDRI